MSENHGCETEFYNIVYYNIAAHIIVICISITLSIIFIQRRHKIKISLIEDDQTLNKVMKKINSEVNEYRVVAVDSEWITLSKTRRRPVALLQLCTIKGTCALIRLNKLKNINNSLSAFLENINIVKVGVQPDHDSKLLNRDYGVTINNFLDLRHLYPTMHGLAELSKDILGITLDKKKEIRCSNWEAENLTPYQVRYASLDVFVAIEIFKKFTGIDQRNRCAPSWSDIEARIQRYLNIPFYVVSTISVENKLRGNKTKMKESMRKVLVSQKSIYDQCYMCAPDGTMICSVKKKKYDWYISQNLAEEISNDPQVMRLRFAPKKIPGTFENSYQKEMKIDRCVVCGINENLLRHWIVPKMYCKFFPVGQKSHFSHDVLVMCLKCFLTQEQSRHSMMEKLKKMSGFETPTVDQMITNRIKNVRSLLKNDKNLSDEKRISLEDKLKQECNLTEINKETLEGIFASDCAERDRIWEERKKLSEGKIVVEFFLQQDSSLLSLRKMWRKHFIDTMNPKFLPKYWSVDHTND